MWGGGWGGRCAYLIAGHVGEDSCAEFGFGRRGCISDGALLLLARFVVAPEFLALRGN